MKREYGIFARSLLFALGVVIVVLWFIFCLNCEMDRTGDLVLSGFFMGHAISVWIFLGMGVALFSLAAGLFFGLIRYLEDERTLHFHNKAKAQKLNTITVILSLFMFIALIAMILGAVNVLMSSGSNANRPGTFYYYYY